MEKTGRINILDKIAVCGAGFQTETIVKYVSSVLNCECLVIVEVFTQKPEDCYRIPSKRNTKRNSFSEVDMMMDEYIESVPVKRFDMLDSEEKEQFTFAFYNSEESMELFKNIKPFVRKYYYIDDDELNQINDCIWKNNTIIKELWHTNMYLYSQIQMLKNAMRRQLKSTVYDFHFEFHLVEHCNLKCAGCTHFSSIAKEEYLSVKEFESDIFRLSELTNSCAKFINLLGGEPLLHPQVCSFMELSRKAFPNSTIRIVTNGIKLKDMREEFWKCCIKNSIIIGITRYPIGINYDGVISTLDSMGISYECFSGNSSVKDEMWRLSLDKTASSLPIDNFIACPRANACVFVSHGKVFNCATMANINHFNECFHTDFKLCEDDYIDIYKINEVDTLLSKLCTPKPFCRFCNINKRRYGIKWAVSQKKEDEWV